MRHLLTFAASITFSLELAGQSPKPSLLDTSRVGVVYHVPSVKKVKAKFNVPFLTEAGTSLSIDIYMPPEAKPGRRIPAVIFLNGVGTSLPRNPSGNESSSSFPRLVAAHGLVGISMDNDQSRIQNGFRALFDFLRQHGSSYGIDSSRIGVYAASANCVEAGRFVMSPDAPNAIKAATFYYGAPPQGQLRKDLPVLFVLPEGDASTQLGRQRGFGKK